MIKYLPDKAYRAIDAISQSTLASFSRLTPKEFYYDQQIGFIETPAMLLGTLVHGMLLDEKSLNTDYAVFKYDGKKTKNYKNTKAYKEAKAKCEADNTGKQVIDEEAWDFAQNMANAISDDTNCALLFAENLVKEHCVLGHEIEGQAVKGKLDAIDNERKLIIDLKTTGLAFDDDSFKRYAASQNFLIQSAFYLDLMKMETGEDYTFVFLCVQTKPPFLSRKIIVNPGASPEYIAEGRRLYRDALRQLMVCREEDYWPGFEGKNVIAQLPRWYKGAN